MRSLLFALSMLLPAASAHADNEDRNVVLINASNAVIVEVYASNKDEGDWQEDMLRGAVAPGDHLNMNIDDGLGYCIYDLKAIGARGEEFFIWGANVCEITTWTLTD